MEYLELAHQIGSRIKELRLKKGLTQFDLSAMCNMERANISRIESGKTNLTLQTIVTLSKVLEIEVKELF